ncbi:HAD family hydrolase [Moraxella sp. ZJ142]|uniref:HAD family hydrolase n=1 Tax=Moraxella marmotae TaxID=3344520 RepID=UPI0035D3E2DC
MAGQIQAVLFDLDGTLIDTAPDFVRIIRQLCDEDGRVAPSEAAIREQVSAGARAMVRLIFGDKFADVADDDEQLLSYRQAFLDRYQADICVDSRVFDGLYPLLELLENQGLPWGIVTNKPRYLAQSLLDKLNLASRCGVLVCPDDVTNTKPDPEPMYLACQTLGVDADRCIYVGDHRRDIQAGAAAGMMTVIAKFGYLSADDLAQLESWGADRIVDTPQQLTQRLKDLIAQP